MPCINQASSLKGCSEGTSVTSTRKDRKTPEPIYTQWSDQHGAFFPAGATVATIPPDIYEIVSTPQGWCLRPLVFPSDELVRLPGTPIDFILGQIDTLWKNEAKFRNIGFLHKRGILMFGAAGCGKTSIIRLLCNDLVERGGIVVFIKNVCQAEEVLKGIRMIESDRPIMCIFEDIEGFMSDDGDSSQARSLLALLDGETQINHVVHLATTNKPQQLEERIIKRPGRFDLVIGLKYPVEDARRVYLKRILKDHVSEEELTRLVKATHGLGLAHLRELVSAVYCLDLDLDDTLNRLRANVKKAPKISKSPDEERLGFSVNYYDGDGQESWEKKACNPQPKDEPDCGRGGGGGCGGGGSTQTPDPFGDVDFEDVRDL